MQHVLCELVISVNAYSFFNQTIEFVFMREPLDKIDSLTYKYKDAQDFFNDNERSITSKISDDFEKRNGCAITNIELGKRGIYIRKGNRNIHPLFETINSKSLKEILIDKLFEGYILVFYECDKRRKKRDETYDSFFSKFDKEAKERLKTGWIRKSDVIYLVSIIMSSNRKNPVIRFLLINMYAQNFSDLYEWFCDTVPSMEDDSLSIVPFGGYAKRLQADTYRYPYIDD